jgi:hypothetical protein
MAQDSPFQKPARQWPKKHVSRQKRRQLQLSSAKLHDFLTHREGSEFIQIGSKN